MQDAIKVREVSQTEALPRKCYKHHRAFPQSHSLVVGQRDSSVCYSFAKGSGSLSVLGCDIGYLKRLDVFHQYLKVCYCVSVHVALNDDVSPAGGLPG